MKIFFTTLFLSMVPVIELRGAIPAGVAGGLHIYEAVFIAVLGNMIPIPFILLFIRAIFEWMRKTSPKLDKVVLRMENKVEKNKKVIDKYEWWGLVILVAIPLPGTGAWTGALVAAMLDMRMKRALPAIFLGVVIAAIIVSYVTYGAAAILN